MSDPYSDRTQTKVKHFILRRYLQALAFKVLRFSDLAYVDGFSGPWKAQTEDFADTSFRIALDVLKDAQQTIEMQTGRRPRVRCFFSESNKQAYTKLAASILPYHRPEIDFHAKTHFGAFEDAITEIQSFIGVSFPLIFIDPTGWTGYSFDKISPLFHSAKSEVLINFMYDFVNRAASMNDPKTVASLNQILGGPDWKNRLDTRLPKGLAVEKLFRDTLASAGSFKFVVSTRIERSTADRPHFFIVYGTKSQDGLKAFRDVEYDALRVNARDRAHAKHRKREKETGLTDMFSDHYAEIQELTVDDLVEEQKTLAAIETLDLLRQRGPILFSELWSALLETHMLRVKDVKDICVALSKSGKVVNSWGAGNRKPRDESLIQLS